ncbi:MAG: hypothetical protein FJX65_17715 [Alphaproteobacteria bacterium]|nr:hypothetical protein [Alphaproteobacteria bacterium]
MASPAAFPVPKAKKTRQAVWLITLADLVMLLLAFFVLLASFASKSDRTEILASVNRAFNESFAGTLDRVERLRLSTEQSDAKGQDQRTFAERIRDSQEAERQRRVEAQAKETYGSIRSALAPELRSDKLEVVTEGNATVVRFGSGNTSFFAPASERPSAEMRPILQRIAAVLQENPGRIVVQGHTDDVHVNTERFRSNWDLSTARAAAVVTELMGFAKIDSQRIVVQGYAETRPLVPNDSPANRAVNRRVEIHVLADDGSSTMIQLR